MLRPVHVSRRKRPGLNSAAKSRTRELVDGEKVGRGIGSAPIEGRNKPLNEGFRGVPTSHAQQISIQIECRNLSVAGGEHLLFVTTSYGRCQK